MKSKKDFWENFGKKSKKSKKRNNHAKNSNIE